MTCKQLTEKLQNLNEDMIEDGNVLTLTSRYGKYETINIKVA